MKPNFVRNEACGLAQAVEIQHPRTKRPINGYSPVLDKDLSIFTNSSPCFSSYRILMTPLGIGVCWKGSTATEHGYSSILDENFSNVTNATPWFFTVYDSDNF